MASTPTTGTEPNLNFDELFAGEQKPGGAAAPVEENLEELEAFLDEFEKNLDGEAHARAARQAPTDSQGAPAAAPEPILAGAFSEPAQAEELVQGLLKENDLDLDVQGEAPAMPSSKWASELPEFEPAPLAPPAFIHAAPATKPIPTAAAGFSRIGFILALVLGGTALLIAIGAGWLAWHATSALQGIESRLEGASPAGAAVDDAKLTQLQGDVTALRRQVEELAKVVEGPIGHLADSYARDMEQLQGRVMQLEKSASALPAAVAAPAEAPKPEAAAKVETAKPEPPKAAGKAPSQPAAAAPKTNGAWLVHLTSSDEKARAEDALARARAAGISSELTSAQMGGKKWYRVTVRGFATADEARAYVTNEAKKAGFGAAWIGKR